MHIQHIPYTYLIGWTSQNKWYYGVEYSQSSKIANPANLWTMYFTSSEAVALYRQQYGEPDIIRVRRTFTDAQKATQWESRVLRRLKVKTDSKWLNLSDNVSFYHRPGKNNTPEHNEAISKSLKGKPKTKTQTDKMVATRRSKDNFIPWNKGLTAETDKRVAFNTRCNNPNRRHTNETKSKISNAKKGSAPWNKGKTNSKISGANNYQAKNVVVDGVKYNTLKEAAFYTGISLYTLRKYHCCV